MLARYHLPRPSCGSVGPLSRPADAVRFLIHKPVSRTLCQAAEIESAAAELPEPQQVDELSFDIPERVLQMNKELADDLKGKFILGPLTKGGNLPFRRMCVEYGAEVTMSEMAYANKLAKGDRVERARLYKAANETCFGVQIATKTIEDGIKAAHLAQEAGARWVDINCGCPIYEATRRGMGAALLRKPSKLAKMVHGIACASPLPITVKIRTGENDKRINAPRVVKLLEAAGAAAVSIHGRTMEQRYKKAADWQLISEVAEQHSVPIIGNGDLLTFYEAEQRRQQGSCHAFMVARGALIKPWIFQEIKEGRELSLSTLERIEVYRRLASYMHDHFGDDDMGKRKAFYFYPWHFNFLVRYRHLPEPVYGQLSQQSPLICMRKNIADPLIGESEEELHPVERLMRCELEAAQGAMAEVLWGSVSDADAMVGLERLAAENLAAWEQQLREGDRREEAATQG